MKIYLACEADKSQQAALTKVGYKNRLMSYFYLRKKKADVLRNIVETDSRINQKPRKSDKIKNADDK
jgi:hypothetical protein